MSNRIYTKEFDTVEAANKFIKDLIDSQVNQDNEYPWYVVDKYQSYNKFCVDYTC